MISRAAVVISILSVPGCAAMVRTWSFHADPVQGPRLEVAVTRANVKQKDAYVTLRIKNRTSSPLRVELATFTLRLPDGEPVLGKTGLMGRAARGARGVLGKLGIAGKTEEPGLAPGAALEARLSFRQNRRDLRRHPRLTIDLSAIRVEGQPARLPQLVLTAPDNAPMGEHI